MTNEEMLNILRHERTEIKDRRGADFSGVEALDMAIKALEQQPCEDCISRTEALKVIEEQKKGFYGVERYAIDECHSAVMKLPSVTPQRKVTGSWVEKQVVDNEEVEIIEWQSARCSKCDKYHTTPYSYYFDDYKYCPNCGSYNGGENDEHGI